MDKASVLRYVVLVIAVLNSFLNLAGYQTIDDNTTNLIVALISSIYALYAGWKNNYLSQKGRAQKEVLKQNDLH